MSDQSAAIEVRTNDFVVVPEVTLPNGTVVPSFVVGKYITGREGDQLSISENATPWTRINFHDSKAEAEKAGLKLITELQYLALAHDIANQDINWLGGKVGEGSIFQGLHRGTVYGAQAGTYVSPEETERRWHQLSNGEQVFDFAGNCFTWVFDDVQGNENGIVAKAFDEQTPSLTTAPYPSRKKGTGWRPDAGDDWSGYALVRGGFWDSDDLAGVFGLDRGDPRDEYGGVGFRCTK